MNIHQTRYMEMHESLEELPTDMCMCLCLSQTRLPNGFSHKGANSVVIVKSQVDNWGKRSTAVL